MTSQLSGAYNLPKKQITSQTAISLPSSPHQFRVHGSETSNHSEFGGNADLLSAWNRVIESTTSENKPLLPYQEWNIDFSELTVGTRVGIGKNSFHLHIYFSLKFS